MSQHYSDLKRETDPHALPDVETFQADYCEDCQNLDGHYDCCEAEGDSAMVRGWFWQSCFPGCMPDSEPFGPFATEADALADARGFDADAEPYPMWAIKVNDRFLHFSMGDLRGEMMCSCWTNREAAEKNLLRLRDAGLIVETARVVQLTREEAITALGNPDEEE